MSTKMQELADSSRIEREDEEDADGEIKEEEEKVQKLGKMGVYIDLLGGLLHYLCLHALSYRVSLLHGISSQYLFTVSIYLFFTVSLHGVFSRVSLSPRYLFTISIFTLSSHLLSSLFYLLFFTFTVPILTLSVS